MKNLLAKQISKIANPTAIATQGISEFKWLLGSVTVPKDDNKK